MSLIRIRRAIVHSQSSTKKIYSLKLVAFKTSQSSAPASTKNRAVPLHKKKCFVKLEAP